MTNWFNRRTSVGAARHRLDDEAQQSRPEIAMERGSRRHQLKIAGEAWLIALTVMFAILLAAVAAGRDARQSTHEKIMAALRGIDLRSASLQRDVLRARAGLSPPGDILFPSAEPLLQVTATLDGLLSERGFNSDDRLEHLLAEFHKGVDADEKLVEQFKTQNTLLEHSFGVLDLTLAALYESPDPEIGSHIAAIGELGNLMHRFATTRDAEIVPAVRRHIGELKNLEVPATESRSLETLVNQVDIILATLPVVEAKIAEILASETSVRTQRLRAQYIELHGVASSSDAWSRALLGTTAILLCLWVFVLVYQLRDQTERLKNRLEYENCVARIKTMMAGTSPRDFPDFMDQVLKIFAAFFGADGCGLAILQEDGDKIENIYSFGRQNDEEVTQVIAFAKNMCREAAQCEDPNARPVCFGSIKPQILADKRENNWSGLVAGRGVSGRRAAVLFFLFGSAHADACPDRIVNMKTTVGVLVELVEHNQNRQQKETLENRLEHAQRLEAVGTLAGGIAHEFNNLLGAILGYGEMALQMLRKPSLTRQYVQEILKSGERAKHVVDQILTFSRKRERISKPFDVVEAIADILPLLQVSLGSQVNLAVTLPAQPAVVEGNPIEIHRIVMNLCKNATEASARGEEVGMEVSLVNVRRRRILSHGEILPGNYVRIEVQDHGSGIPLHLLPHIFEPFFTTKAQSGGTGLGLSAVHGAVSGLGGCINVQSAVALGTRFELFLPASSQTPVPVKSFFNERQVPTGEGQKIAILERDVSLLVMYEEKVAALGYEPAGYDSLDAILQSMASKETRPDLVIVDSNSLNSSVPVAQLDSVFTGIPYLLLIDRGREGRFAGCQLLWGSALKKPFSSKALADAIFDRITLSR